ncbi:MAG: hypothetical protein JO130_16945 [Solirubrobacterales bacterium]|nr:hypothetical protein [Solirubrobacterales bacterium]
MKLTVIITQERAGYDCDVQELPGCSVRAGTLAELHETLAETVGVYLWDMPAELSRPQLTVGEMTIEATPPMPDPIAPSSDPDVPGRP